MKEATLNNLLMISVEGPPIQQMDFNTAADIWAQKKNRRLDI